MTRVRRAMPGGWPVFEQAVKRRTMRRLERRMARPLRSPRELEARPPERILVVRQHDQIGDFLLATPVLRALRARWPGAHLGIVIRGYFEGVIRHHPHVDEVLVYPEAIHAWTPRAVRAFRPSPGRRWDLAVVLNTVSHSITSDLVARFSGAPFILGSEHRVFAGCVRNFLYDLVAPYAPGPRHQSDRNLDIVRYVGADTDSLAEEMRLLPAECEEARRKLESLGLGTAPADARPVIGVHPGAGKAANRWPVERFAVVAERLSKELGAAIVVFWGPGEDAIAQAFLARMRAAPIAVPPGPVRDLAAALAACDLALVNDTGVMHIAAAAGVPLVAVFGPTDPAEWKPAGDRFVAVRGASGSTEGVPVDAVESAARSLLALVARRS